MVARKASTAPERKPPSAPHKPGGLHQLLTNTRLAALLLLSGLFLATMMVLAIWGDRGALTMWRRQHEVVQLGYEIEAIEHENARLRQEIQRLRSDMSYIEKIAREELGLVRPGELVFEFVEPEERRD
jgi:cell division protein FtsB